MAWHQDGYLSYFAIHSALTIEVCLYPKTQQILKTLLGYLPPELLRAVYFVV
mgnify:FL=1